MLRRIAVLYSAIDRHTARGRRAVAGAHAHWNIERPMN